MVLRKERGTPYIAISILAIKTRKTTFGRLFYHLNKKKSYYVKNKKRSLNDAFIALLKEIGSYNPKFTIQQINLHTIGH